MFGIAGHRTSSGTSVCRFDTSRAAREGDRGDHRGECRSTRAPRSSASVRRGIRRAVAPGLRRRDRGTPRFPHPARRRDRRCRLRRQHGSRIRGGRLRRRRSRRSVSRRAPHASRCDAAASGGRGGGTAQHGPQEQAAGLQDAPDLDQRAGQIIDPMQVHRAQHQLEGARREGQRFLVGDNGRAVGSPGKTQSEPCLSTLVGLRFSAERHGPGGPAGLQNR